MQNYLFPLSVRMLDPKIFAISFSSFKNQATSSGFARLLSRSNANHNLLSLVDLREVLKKLVNPFCCLLPVLQYNFQ